MNENNSQKGINEFSSTMYFLGNTGLASHKMGSNGRLFKHVLSLV